MEKRIAIYCRVSTSEQTTATQRMRLEEYAVQNGWHFDLYEETESSRNTRPVKAEVLKKLREGIYAGVVVYRLDRWARSSTELVLELSEFQKKNIEFHSYSEKLDFTTAAGKLYVNLLIALCDFERELIRERTLEALRRIRKTKKLGRPFGAKDKKKRCNEGYLEREAEKRLSNNTPPKQVGRKKAA